MFNKLSLFALALALPLAACGDADTVEPTDDVDVVVTDPAPVEEAPMTEATDVTAQATIDAVPAEGLTAMAPGAAVANIDAWIAKLSAVPEASGVVEGLETLKGQLTADELDGAAIGATLMSLGEQTTASAGDDTALQTLGGALSSAGATLSGN